MQYNKLPLWGPYSKKYMGISKIIEKLSDEGARFDFSVHPTLWNSSTPVPNVTVPSNYHLWNCNADYTYFSYRYELMWKDQVYADISFSKMKDNAYLMRCELVNNTPLSQNCILNLFSSMEYPYPTYCSLDTPSGAIVKTANDYDEYEYAVKRPWDNENPDGMFKGMFIDKDFYLGKGLGDRCENYHVHFLNLKPFGCEKGDRVSYTLNCGDIKAPVVVVRYKSATDDEAVFSVNGELVVFPVSKELSTITIKYSDFIELVSQGKGGIELDFLAVVESGEESLIKTTIVQYPFIPEIDTEILENGHTTKLTYTNAEQFYIMTHNVNTRERTLDSGSLEDALINRLSNGDHTYDDLKETFSNSFKRKNSDLGFFQNTLIKSIFINPGESHIEYAVISNDKPQPLSNEEYEEIYLAAKQASPKINYNAAGEKYSLSTEILKATLLTNAVYPVYRHGENVVHHTPGKRWDSFYTWDSGFIGMGLLEFSKELCKYALDLYLCDESNKDFAFLLHGSLVPTQFVEYFELLKRTNDKSTLEFLYDKMKHYYEFLRGRNHNSTVAKFNNGLLTTYDYWYSHCGMDDYPAQVEMMNRKSQKFTCPCLSTAQIIRAGKIMRMVAVSLGRNEDIEIYDEDIEYSTNALNTLAWDEESGYYGYTIYDENGQVVDIMRTADGENFNKGMDGIYPLVAGAIKDKERKSRVISHIKNPNEMWSQAGISAVDMSSSYYMEDGYWNGNVWMSHQWFVWKTMLDNGDTDFAYDIAKTALDMWKDETDFTYNTFECFGISTKRGGWFHNFGGLSAPICIWANCYFKPETVTTGFDVWTDYQKTTSNSADVSFKYYGESDKYSMVVTLSDRCEYKAYLDDKEISFVERNKGSLEFTFDGDVKSGVLKIKGV